MSEEIHEVIKYVSECEDKLRNTKIEKLQSRINELESAVMDLGNLLGFYYARGWSGGEKANEMINKHKDLIESITKEGR